MQPDWCYQTCTTRQEQLNWCNQTCTCTVQSISTAGQVLWVWVWFCKCESCVCDTTHIGTTKEEQPAHCIQISVWLCWSCCLVLGSGSGSRGLYLVLQVQVLFHRFGSCCNQTSDISPLQPDPHNTSPAVHLTSFKGNSCSLLEWSSTRHATKSLWYQQWVQRYSGATWAATPSDSLKNTGSFCQWKLVCQGYGTRVGVADKTANPRHATSPSSSKRDVCHVWGFVTSGDLWHHLHHLSVITSTVALRKRSSFPSKMKENLVPFLTSTSGKSRPRVSVHRLCFHLDCAGLGRSHLSQCGCLISWSLEFKQLASHAVVHSHQNLQEQAAHATARGEKK